MGQQPAVLAIRSVPACNVSLRSQRPAVGRSVVAWIALALAGGCGGEPACTDCDTVVIAVTGEPTTLVPPLIAETVGRDVSDLVFERLATLAPGGSPNDSAAYRPGLAERWEQVDSVTWRFVLRPGASWHDGRPVEAEDVRFSFAAFVDTSLGAPAATQLVGRVTVEVESATAVRIRFNAPAPEMLYDATYHVRIMPRHLWESLPGRQWSSDTSTARLVGSGPFRLVGWVRGQSLTIERVTAPPAGQIRRLIWRFAGDQDAAVNLLLAHEADITETVTSPSGREQIRADTTLREVPYASGVYGFVGLLHRRPNGSAHPVLSNRAVRRALTLAIDRPTLVHAVVGPNAVVPPGPLSRALWIWSDRISTLGYDTAAANRLLDSAGYPRGGRDGMRRLAVDILVPGTSVVRRGLAQGIQEMWRQVGVSATVTAVDFPVFQERLGAGRFDAMIGAWLDEPSPRALADQWTRAGWGVLNHGRYGNPAFDSLLALASATSDPARAGAVWREAMDTLNADAAGIFLYTPTNVAVASRRLDGVEINPVSWLSGVTSWRVLAR